MEVRKNKNLSLFWQKGYNIIFTLCIILLAACNNGEDKEPDVSGIKIKLDSKRFDLDFSKIDTTRIADGLQQLAPQYPDFLDFYLDTLMGFNVQQNYSDTTIAIRRNVYGFLTHHDFRGVFDTVKKHFPDVKHEDEQLTKSFRYMKYYFPEYKVPKIIYLVTGLGMWNAFTVGDEIIGVGLDMALGAKYPNYSRVEIPDYTIRNLTKESIPVNVFHAVYTNMHPFVMENKNLLEMMIQKGKEQYFISKMVPYAHDSLQFGFSKAQLDWCNENEAGIYNFFTKGQLLYESNWQKVVRYVIDGPSAAGMAPESPGNVGSFIGYRIIRSYMKQHPEVTLPVLFATEDAQKILREAQYKPR